MGEFGGSLDPTMFNGAATLADGVAFFHGGGASIVAVDAETGEILHRKCSMPNTSNPAVWRHKGKEYLLTSANGLTCYEPRTGRIVWNYKYASGRRGPVVHGDYCFTDQHVPVTGAHLLDDGPQMLKLTLDGAEKLWQFKKYMAPCYVCPAFIDDTIWVVNRGGGTEGFPVGSGRGSRTLPGFGRDIEAHFEVAVCADYKTGRIVNYIDNIPLKLIGSLSGSDRRVIINGAQAQRVQSMPRGLHYYDLTPENPRYLGHIRTSYSYCVTPLFVDGKFYYKDPNHLLNCYDMRADRTAVKQDKTPGCAIRKALVRICALRH